MFFSGGWERDLHVTGGDSYEFVPEVCRSTGWVVVRSDQRDDEVSIDGREVGRSNDSRHALSAGEHEVRVERKGYEPWEGVVSIEPGQTTGIRPRLSPLRKPQEQKQPKPRQHAAATAAVVAQSQPSQEDLKTHGGWYEEAKHGP